MSFIGALYATAPENIIVCEDELDEYTISGVIGGGVGLVNYGWYFDGEFFDWKNIKLFSRQ